MSSARRSWAPGRCPRKAARKNLSESTVEGLDERWFAHRLDRGLRLAHALLNVDALFDGL